MPAVQQRETARRDLIEHFVYLAEHAGIDLADRFLVSVEETFNDLARHPQMGAPLKLKHPGFANIRKWRVNDFDSHLIFYEPRASGLSIVRVLHAVSNWWQMPGFEG